MSNLSDAAQGLSATLNLVSKNMQSAKANSYIEFAKMTLAEAPTVIDATIAQIPQTTAILQSCINQFAVWYIQAATIHMNLGNVNITKALDPLNPRRDPGSSFFSNLSIGTKAAGLLDFDGGLNPYAGLSRGLENFGAEMGGVDVRLNTGRNNQSGTVSDFNSIVKDAVNLSVGKVIKLDVREGDKTAAVPITIRLRTGIMEPQPLQALISADSRGKEGFFTQLKGLSAGQKSFWRDLMFQKTLVDEHRDALLRDTTGMYKERIVTTRKNRLSGVLSLNPSIANFSSIYVIAQDTLDSLAAYKRIDFSRPKVRKQIFETLGAILIVVVNTRWETVTFWRHSIDEPVESTYSQITKEFTNPKEVNMSEMFRTMGLFANPSL